MSENVGADNFKKICDQMFPELWEQSKENMYVFGNYDEILRKRLDNFKMTILIKFFTLDEQP